jgi:hypothetical protein
VHAQPVEGEVIDGRPRFAEARPIDPGRAARLSIVPGLGHWYARAPVRGLAFFVAIVGPLVLGTELDLSVIGLPLGIPMDMGGLGLWVYCAVDAYRTAKRTIGPR